MSDILLYTVAYAIGVNIVTFATFGIDKQKARRGQWRVSETTLLWLCGLGGCVGGLIGMRMWHHKTKHKKFVYGVPVIFILHLTMIFYTIKELL